MDNQKELIEEIDKISRQYWEKNKAPMLLSALPKSLEEKQPSYRDTLGELSLKKFIQNTEKDGNYRLIEHSTLRAKIAVLPTGIDYKFPDDEPRKLTKETTKKGPQEATLTFLRVLAEQLPESDLDKVVIPVSVLTKLLK